MNLPFKYRIISSDAVTASDFLELAKPLSVLSPDMTHIHYDKNYTSRPIKAALPQNNFFKIPNHNIFIASPELTFIQAASNLSFAELVKLGFNLCAQYNIDENNSFRQEKRTIVTTKMQIIQLTNDFPKLYGATKARKAAKYILEDSNSPMESCLGTIFNLPISHGGYGLKGSEMNGYIELDQAGKKLVGCSGIRGDITWKKQKVCAEYNSKLAHTNEKTYYDDSNRANAVRLAGWQYIGITPENIKNFSSVENIAEIIRIALKLPDRHYLLEAYRDLREDNYMRLFSKYY